MKVWPLVLAGCLLLGASSAIVLHHHALKPKRRFEQLLIKPMPSTVRILRHEEIWAMDSFFWACRFQASATDINLLRDNLKFATAPVENMEFWNSRLEGDGNLDISITTNWCGYELHDKDVHKYLFVNTNTSEAVFVFDEH